ncbi:MAG: carboxypeptidase-like regulatory domain-containing protein, partial [Candidatus Hydrogenedentes bacterium]|nr:carboxypeptidase-like regulatory domain-containing protein [Candidatus Hydrogenedentota bacterium]
MHRTVVRLLLVWAVWGTGSPASVPVERLAELSGVVADSGGRRVVVRLRAMDDNPLRYYDGYEEMTGPDGRFRFGQIKPGRYRVETATRGLRLAAVTTVNLRAGEKRRGFKVRVAPSFSLCGRVTGEGASRDGTYAVSVYRLIPEYSVLTQRHFLTTRTDGRFLWEDMEPAAYYLSAPANRRFSEAQQVTVGEGTPAGCSPEVQLQSSSCWVQRILGQIGASV